MTHVGIILIVNLYYTYIVKCNDDTLYTGITNNLHKRVLDHNTSKRGAKYTLKRRPVVLVYWEEYNNRSEAQKREACIKKLSRVEKIELIKKTQTSIKI
ncbi:MAG: GIY-YIG nuclease family protein [Patescibacteria group bacterium]|uniref:GIY-YIG nuclease family protein n=1 Tax=candidate division WWE3 bacterium TaxID=2053526 RepID=A0A955ECP0_UNCKA|nr:GIY-YIG nuclease family protein [candidate division WWE3 bacterium]